MMILGGLGVAHERGTPLGPLGVECSQDRQTLRPSSSRDPQQSPASFRSAVKDLEDPAVQCRWLAVSEALCLGAYDHPRGGACPYSGVTTVAVVPMLEGYLAHEKCCAGTGVPRS